MTELKNGGRYRSIMTGREGTLRCQNHAWVMEWDGRSTETGSPDVWKSCLEPIEDTLPTPRAGERWRNIGSQKAGTVYEGFGGFRLCYDDDGKGCWHSASLFVENFEPLPAEPVEEPTKPESPPEINVGDVIVWGDGSIRSVITGEGDEEDVWWVDFLPGFDSDQSVFENTIQALLACGACTLEKKKEPRVEKFAFRILGAYHQSHTVNGCYFRIQEDSPLKDAAWDVEITLTERLGEAK